MSFNIKKKVKCNLNLILGVYSLFYRYNAIPKCFLLEQLLEDFNLLGLLSLSYNIPQM